MKTVTISLERVRDAQVRAIMEDKSLSDVQKNILLTLAYSNPLWIADLGVKRVMRKGENVVILHTENAGVTVNVEIVYSEVKDLYDVKFYMQRRGIEPVTKEFEDVFCEELYPLLQSQISRMVIG
jgi:hypothetical protein